MPGSPARVRRGNRRAPRLTSELRACIISSKEHDWIWFRRCTSNPTHQPQRLSNAAAVGCMRS